MESLKTLGRTTWDNIEVGEVFAEVGCWSILEKMDNGKVYVIAGTDHIYTGVDCIDNENLYKLPISVQQLWKTE